ncbi:LOW QUALITY PROTEIN: glutamate-rich protein 3 [Centrocercus urophasianus]|uniref:LOW QUALITY PROTEIN: glutamate-rich protein 3 n=1 Tax=Centrocercus urophasianus TaxID=9002 RepID=UPI001C64B5D3|nr:LOW QUALITY PROTEIN: glutamate-rich protein 3 [Centrocercus urophasianus]
MLAEAVDFLMSQWEAGGRPRRYGGVNERSVGLEGLRGRRREKERLPRAAEARTAARCEKRLPETGGRALPAARGRCGGRRCSAVGPAPQSRVLATAWDASGGVGQHRAAPSAAPGAGAAMSGPQPGFLATYNSLTDKHLAGYFSNARIRRHLQRSGLISKSGRIIPEKEYRLNALRRDHQRYVQECLTRAVFLKVLDMERHHQLEVRRKLESSVRKARVQKTKMERPRRPVEDANPLHSPRPPLGSRNPYGRHPLMAGEPAARSQLRAPGPIVDYRGGHPFDQHRSKELAFLKTASSHRPNTAPGNMQYPLRLQPLHSCAAAGAVPRSSGSKQKCSTLENYQQFASGRERSGLRFMNSVEYASGKSPYRLPVINNYLIPVPPPTLQKRDRSVKAVRNGTCRRRRFRPTTAPNGLEQLVAKNSGEFLKPSLHSNAFVTMIFLGKSVHLSHDDSDYRDEIKIYQQHCGGENLCVYKGKLLEGETFQFVSKRHRGFPFSLTFFLNGMQVDRLSSCCEYRHQKRSRLGGRHGYFGFLNVEGASPCYRCIVAMGLDKKPSPPKREMEEDCEGKQVGSWKDGVHSEPSGSSTDQKSSKESVLVILPSHEADVETVEDKMETGQDYEREEGTKLPNCEAEDSQEDTGKNEYNEDFEADEVSEEGQTGDQRNGMSKSSPDDEKHNLDYEEESKDASQKALQASDSEKDESDGSSDSTSENGKPVCASSLQTLLKCLVGEVEVVPVNRLALNVVGKHVMIAGIPEAVTITPSKMKSACFQKSPGRLKLDRSSAPSLSSTSTQYSSEDESDTEKMKENVKGKEERDIKEASDNTACALYGNESGENKLFRTEDSQKTFSLEEEGMDEAETTKTEALTSRENTEAFHENILEIQHQSPDVTGEMKQAGSMESSIRGEEEKKANNRRDSGEKNVSVPLEKNMMEVKDGNEESPQSDEGGVSEDDRSAQEEITEAMGNDHHVNFDHECSVSCVDEEVENATSAESDPSEACVTGQLQQPRVTDVLLAVTVTQAAAGGAVLADTTGAPSTQSEAVEVAHVGKDHGEEGGHAGTDCGGHTAARAGELQPEGEEAAVAPERHLLVDELAPAKGAMTEGDAEEREPGMGTEPGVEVEDQDAPTGAGENMGPWRDPAGEGEEQVGMGALLGVGGARGITGGERAVDEASEEQRVVGTAVSVSGGMMPEGWGAAEDADLAEGTPEVGDLAAVWATEKAAFEGQKTVEEAGALPGTSEDTEFCTGKEEILKPNEFCQLQVSEEEQVEMDALGTATFEPDRPPEEEGSSQPRAEDMEEPEDSGRDPALHSVPGREVGEDAGRDSANGGSTPLEQTVTAGDEEGSAIVLLSGSLPFGSAAKTDRAMEEKSDRVVMGVSEERARAESEDEEVRGGAAGPQEQVAMGQGLLECGTGGEQAVLGEGRPPGQGVMGCEALEAAQGTQGRGCLGLWGQQPAVPASGAAPEDTVPAGVQIEGKLPELGLGESTQRKEMEAVLEGTVGCSDAQEQRIGSPEQEHGHSEDVNLDAVVIPQDKEETIL